MAFDDGDYSGEARLGRYEKDHRMSRKQRGGNVEDDDEYEEEQEEEGQWYRPSTRSTNASRGAGSRPPSQLMARRRDRQRERSRGRVRQSRQGMGPSASEPDFSRASDRELISRAGQKSRAHRRAEKEMPPPIHFSPANSPLHKSYRQLLRRAAAS